MSSQSGELPKHTIRYGDPAFRRLQQLRPAVEQLRCKAPSSWSLAVAVAVAALARMSDSNYKAEVDPAAFKCGPSN